MIIFIFSDVNEAAFTPDISVGIKLSTLRVIIKIRKINNAIINILPRYRLRRT